MATSVIPDHQPGVRVLKRGMATSTASALTGPASSPVRFAVILRWIGRGSAGIGGLRRSDHYGKDISPGPRSSRGGSIMYSWNIWPTLGLTKLRIAETEKDAHVTFFYGCADRRFAGEEHPFRHPMSQPMI